MRSSFSRKALGAALSISLAQNFAEFVLLDPRPRAEPSCVPQPVSMKTSPACWSVTSTKRDDNFKRSRSGGSGGLVRGVSVMRPI